MSSNLLKERQFYECTKALHLEGTLIPSDPDKKVIEKAYRKLALKTHPDKGGDAAAFRKVKDAYTRLIGHITQLEAIEAECDLSNNSIILEISKQAIKTWTDRLTNTYGRPRTDNVKNTYFEGPCKQFRGNGLRCGGLIVVLYEDPEDGIPKIHCRCPNYMGWLQELQLPLHLHVPKGRNIRFDQWRLMNMAEFGFCKLSSGVSARHDWKANNEERNRHREQEQEEAEKRRREEVAEMLRKKQEEEEHMKQKLKEMEEKLRKDKEEKEKETNQPWWKKHVPGDINIRIGETTPPPEDADIAEARAASDVNFEEARAASTTPTPARKKMATEENGLKPPQPTQPQQQKQPSTPSASPTGKGMKYVDDAVREAARLLGETDFEEIFGKEEKTKIDFKMEDQTQPQESIKKNEKPQPPENIPKNEQSQETITKNANPEISESEIKIPKVIIEEDHSMSDNTTTEEASNANGADQAENTEGPNITAEEPIINKKEGTEGQNHHPSKHTENITEEQPITAEKFTEGQPFITEGPSNIAQTTSSEGPSNTTEGPSKTTEGPSNINEGPSITTEDPSNTIGESSKIQIELPKVDEDVTMLSDTEDPIREIPEPKVETNKTSQIPKTPSPMNQTSQIPKTPSPQPRKKKESIVQSNRENPDVNPRSLPPMSTPTPRKFPSPASGLPPSGLASKPKTVKQVKKQSAVNKDSSGLSSNGGGVRKVKSKSSSPTRRSSLTSASTLRRPSKENNEKASATGESSNKKNRWEQKLNAVHAGNSGMMKASAWSKMSSYDVSDPDLQSSFFEKEERPKLKPLWKKSTSQDQGGGEAAAKLNKAKIGAWFMKL